MALGIRWSGGVQKFMQDNAGLIKGMKIPSGHSFRNDKNVTFPYVFVFSTAPKNTNFQNI